ncbi:GILT-like protein 1 [Daktulosphaira vitifoliae]|uniref:GILT-like protein 1 n=1 Tax=Daktulosphaira vitifoliae TaxID=58002 RepID=UPI0021A99EE4|nr:GILT-like protein 1 [Daktulosphaira vitifoliae]
MEHRVKSFLVILTLATLAQYYAQETSKPNENPSSPAKITVQVFYEGHSVDSKKFIKEQLIPTNKALNEYMDIKLMPFALGHIQNQNTTEYTLTCGSDKSNNCIEDKVHACAISLLDQNKTLDFINCTMLLEEADVNEKIKKCGNDIKLDSDVISGISNCVNKDFYALLKKDETAHIEANIKTVPTVFIANNNTEDTAELAKSDLKKAVCESIPEPKPSQCSTSGADAIIAGMLPLLIGAYFFIKSF